jgi:putative tryptophan/tyrosine transport system substrate-binding protein
LRRPIKERIVAIRKGLQELGFIEGTNYSLAVRFADGNFDRLPSLVIELGALKPRLIVASANAVGPVRRSLPDTPLVFTGFAADPVALGLAESYVRPGGRITGNVMNAVGGEVAMTQKRIGLLRDLVPNLTRLGMIAPDPRPGLAITEKDALQKVAAQRPITNVRAYAGPISPAGR